MPIAEFLRILVCIDGSEYSIKIANCAISIARKYNSKITALTVLNISDIHKVTNKEKLSHLAYSEEMQKPKDLLNKIAQKAGEVGVILSTEILDTTQRPEKAILQYSGNENVDLIVVGAGDSKIKKFLIGSVASYVISNAKCTTMVVK